jgi:hypothetical protein
MNIDGDWCGLVGTGEDMWLSIGDSRGKYEKLKVGVWSDGLWTKGNL